jgi:type IV secretory pathway VirB10-like protein
MWETCSEHGRRINARRLTGKDEISHACFALQENGCKHIATILCEYVIDQDRPPKAEKTTQPRKAPKSPTKPPNTGPKGKGGPKDREQSQENQPDRPRSPRKPQSSRKPATDKAEARRREEVIVKQMETHKMDMESPKLKLKYCNGNCLRWLPSQDAPTKYWPAYAAASRAICLHRPCAKSSSMDC